ncbi:MAG: glycosyltransferase family 2 protein [Ginsengibacter sp.]
MSSEPNPLVSVLMTAYNREKYIAEAIESVLASTYTNFELIIVDDGSVDNTVKIAKAYATKDERIKVYVNEKNLGDYPNRNKAASYAKGEFLMYVDSDDMIYTDSIAHCISEVQNDSSIGMGMICRDKSLQNKVLLPEQSINYHFFKKPFLFIGPGGTILRKSFFEHIKNYPTQYGPANDMYFNLKAASNGKIKCISKEFLNYRIHEGQEQNNSDSYLFNNYKYMRDALNDLPLPIDAQQKKWLSRKNKRRFVVNISRFFFQTFNIKKSTKAIKLADFHFKDFIQGVFH